LSPPWRHVGAPDPFPGERGVRAPEAGPGGQAHRGLAPTRGGARPPGGSGPMEAIPEHPILVGMWRHRTYMSSGEKVRRLCPQLSGPGCTPRHPEDEGEVTDNLTLIWLGTLSDDSLTITTFWSLSSSLAMIGQGRPNMWWRVSSTMRLVHTPDVTP
jgi:hypothetical protein